MWSKTLAWTSKDAKLLKQCAIDVFWQSKGFSKTFMVKYDKVDIKDTFDPKENPFGFNINVFWSSHFFRVTRYLYRDDHMFPHDINYQILRNVCTLINDILQEYFWVKYCYGCSLQWHKTFFQQNLSFSL